MSRSDPIPVMRTAGLAGRLGRFRSLGGNCEFGFVQRYGGSEASGLLRFAFTPLGDLVHALSTDFTEYGAPGDLHIRETETGYYYCASRRYDIWANTRHAAGSIDPAKLLEREYGKVAHLKRTMLADLEQGSKILVRKTSAADDPADLDRLALAIERHGPSTLLQVSEAGPTWAASPVSRLTENRLAGTVRAFAPLEQAWDVDLEPWIALCESAYACRYGAPDPSRTPDRDALRLPTRVKSHRGRYRTHTLSAFIHPVDTGALDPERIYVFSAWVWIGKTFSGSRVHGVFGYDRLGWRDADLTLRECWQRVWSAGRIGPARPHPKVGLGLVGGRDDRFWSCGWRLHEGAIPEASSEPPTVRIEPWYRRPVSAWLP